eukprot:NODE_3783_length_1288_cov_16.834335_g3313_i0.p1 GENE.NODE_3783_length_1288_cov_16.834335_g3313_i0~~NODE_3783_length_1288_cov_16.834335_g3313_i0.p1  ORF type:complete len:414 (+),score=67.68 NODE_3783_length_1288_cov_16.834335_g3313_i0:53-1243(+)
MIHWICILIVALLIPSNECRIRSKVLCTKIDFRTVKCYGLHFVIPRNGTSIAEEPTLGFTGMRDLIMAFASLLLAGVASGLTLGLFSLDPIKIEVMKNSGTPSQRSQAAIIMSITKNHHVLLVTLLLTNAIAAECTPIFLEQVFSPMASVTVGTLGLLIFGEIVPQSLFKRYPVRLGVLFTPLVWLLLVVFFFVSYPFGKILDCLVGSNPDRFYDRKGLKQLMQIHLHNPLTEVEVLLSQQTFELGVKMIKDKLVNLDTIYSVSYEDPIPRESLVELPFSSLPLFPYLPVYSGHRNNLIGVLNMYEILKNTNTILDIKNYAIYHLPLVNLNSTLSHLYSNLQKAPVPVAIVTESTRNETSHHQNIVGLIGPQQIFDDTIRIDKVINSVRLDVKDNT